MMCFEVSEVSLKREIGTYQNQIIIYICRKERTNTFMPVLKMLIYETKPNNADVSGFCLNIN